MEKNFLLKICVIAALCFSPALLKAQQVNTLYFMDNVPVRNSLNPAFQPYSNFYFGLPVLGYTRYNLWNNSVSIKDIIYKVNGKSVYFVNEYGDKDKLYNTLKKNILVSGELNLSLLDFGFRKGNGYWTFGLNQRVEFYSTIPKDAVKLMLYRTPFVDGNDFNMTSLQVDMKSYTEFALGYSCVLNDKITVGGKVKVLLGNACYTSSNSSLKLNAGIDQWSFTGQNQMNYAGPMTLSGEKFEDFRFSEPSSTSDYFKPTGFGTGIDLGITYKPVPELTLSAALLDFGFITWINNVSNSQSKINYLYKGLGNLNLNSTLSPTAILDSISHAIKTATDTKVTNNEFTTYTSPKLNIGAEYGFYENRLSLGLLSKTTLYGSRLAQEVTTSVNGRPVEWFNMSLSYSFLSGRANNIGVGVGVRTGFLHWFAAADYVPFSYATLPLQAGSAKINLPVSYNSKGMNLAFGVNIVFGNRKDDDHDGVVNKRDKCPETPYSVVVDKDGCPLDTDGDGVPDYLDKCPKTPREAYNHIDQNGCPVDNDSDGIADYKDKCPDTSPEARAYVDSTGCVKDTDKDGVYDFKDKCPDTAPELRAYVDSTGCVKDSDKDGVYDFRDKCPGTPVGVKVDSVGCPLDSDLDGVPDFKDKCPDTPVAERSTVDSTGCSRKTIAPVVALSGNSNAVINDKDTDGDGVPDRIDNCPNERGPASNHGCPDAKKELKNLFQKALQGIQFETGKHIIKPSSFRILNQIADVLKMHKDYLVEIRGHTDNMGNAAKNKELSDRRAKEVMKYLVKKGVEAKQLSAVGFGQTIPVASNKTAAGRALNRRVEFLVTYQEVTFE